MGGVATGGGSIRPRLESEVALQLGISLSLTEPEAQRQDALQLVNTVLEHLERSHSLEERRNHAMLVAEIADGVDNFDAMIECSGLSRLLNAL